MKQTIIQKGIKFYKLVFYFEIKNISELKKVLTDYDVRLLQRDDESCSNCLNGKQSPIYLGVQ